MLPSALAGDMANKPEANMAAPAKETDGKKLFIIDFFAHLNQRPVLKFINKIGR